MELFVVKGVNDVYQNLIPLCLMYTRNIGQWG